MSRRTFEPLQRRETSPATQRPFNSSLAVGPAAEPDGIVLVWVCRACWERHRPGSVLPSYSDRPGPCVSCGGQTRCVYKAKAWGR